MKRVSKGDVFSGFIGAMLISAPTFADGIQNTLNSTISYIQTVIGPAIAIIAFLVGCGLIASGHREGVKRCVYSLVGGLLMSLGAWVYTTVIGWGR